MNDGYLEILNSIASSSPTPGGGSVAALSLAHAHSLAAMVSQLTLKSDKWSEGHDIANQIIQQSEERIQNSLSLAEEDAAAFDAVMAAYRLPRDGDNLTIRSDAIRLATIYAARVPSDTVSFATQLLVQFNQFAPLCNLNALTDLAASAELAFSALKIAEMNVRINIHDMDGDDVELIKEMVRKSMAISNQEHLEICETYIDRLGW